MTNLLIKSLQVCMYVCIFISQQYNNLSLAYRYIKIIIIIISLIMSLLLSHRQYRLLNITILKVLETGSNFLHIIICCIYTRQDKTTVYAVYFDNL